MLDSRPPSHTMEASRNSSSTSCRSYRRTSDIRRLSSAVPPFSLPKNPPPARSSMIWTAHLSNSIGLHRPTIPPSRSGSMRPFTLETPTRMQDTSSAILSSTPRWTSHGPSGHALKRASPAASTVPLGTTSVVVCLCVYVTPRTTLPKPSASDSKTSPLRAGTLSGSSAATTHPIPSSSSTL